MSCACKKRPAQYKVLVICMRCGALEPVAKRVLPQSSTLCKSCFSKPVRVQCSDCGKDYTKVRHGLYGWTGRCAECGNKKRRGMKHRQVLLICMECCALEPFPRAHLQRGTALCAKCHGRRNVIRFFKRRAITLPCLECGWVCQIRPQYLPKWQGRCHQCANTLKWYSMPEEKRRQILERAKCFQFAKGHQPANWKGGITPIMARIRTSQPYLNWARAVKKRDNFTCQMCGTRGGRLHSDHILPFATHPELRLDLDNGRTLCAPCHRARHKKEGKPRKKPVKE